MQHVLPEKASIILEIQQALKKLDILNQREDWTDEDRMEFRMQLECVNRNYHYLELYLDSVKVSEDLQAEEVQEEVELAEELEQLEEEVVLEESTEETRAEMPEELEEEEKGLGLGARTPISERSFDDHSFANKMEQQSIPDLKQAIGLNERFFYANELFRGDGTEYSRAIEELNHLGSMEDAKRLIQTKYEERFKWDYESEAVSSFLSLLNRRYQKA